MKKKYTTEIIIILAVTVVFVIYTIHIYGISAVKNSFENEKQDQIIVSEIHDTSVSPFSTEIKPDDLSKNNVGVTDNKQVQKTELKSMLKADNEFSDKPAAEQDNSVAELIQTLDDPSNDSTYRVDIAKTLIKSGTKKGVMSVLKAILIAHVQEEYVFKENLMQIFSGVNSAEAADMLTDVLTGKTPLSPDLVKIPEDISYALKNAIRMMPNEAVGEILAQKYHNASSEEEKKELSDIKHPVMLAKLADDAFRLGDNKTADRFMEELTGTDDNSAIKGIMVLAREKSVSLDNAVNILSFWNFTTPDKAETHFTLVEYLGNTDFSPEERALAAYAMANEKDKEMAISALKKARLFEEDPLVQQYIENALSQIAESEAVE